MFKNAKFIWIKNSKVRQNEYGDFYFDLYLKDINDVFIYVCSISEYVLYVNDKMVSFGQYPNFKDLKYYDSIKLDSYLSKGLNSFKITALSKNYNTSGHIKDDKGLIFEVRQNGNTILTSNKEIISSLNPNYHSGKIHYITKQLGMGYSYSFVDSKVLKNNSVEKNYNTLFNERPIEKLILEKIKFEKVKNNIYGSTKELTGYLYFEIESEEEQDLIISYGEHISDGCVRRIISTRDFSVSFHLKKGLNTFNGYFLRMGLRYLELSEFKGTVKEIGVINAYYPYKVQKLNNNILKEEMVNKALYTLVCCKHEHYEDCPWREQAQYTMDSRLELLLDYYAFKEYKFARASLKMMSKNLTSSSLFTITSPTSGDLAIPVYSLVYPLMLKEYYLNTNDSTLLEEVYGNTKIMIDGFMNRFNGYLLNHEKEWNFYEWTKGLSNDKEINNPKEQKNTFDFILNAYFVIGLEGFSFISNVLSKDCSQFQKTIEVLRHNLVDVFYKKGYFYSYLKNGKLEGLHEYTNYLALFINLLDSKEEKELLDRVINKKRHLLDLSLCNYIFKYDVLFRYDEYLDYIIKDVSEIWGKMDALGATTYFETINGDKDFGGAGSLCHGWSTIPAYIAYLYDKKHTLHIVD